MQDIILLDGVFCVGNHIAGYNIYQLFQESADEAFTDCIGATPDWLNIRSASNTSVAAWYQCLNRSYSSFFNDRIT